MAGWALAVFWTLRLSLNEADEEMLQDQRDQDLIRGIKRRANDVPDD